MEALEHSNSRIKSTRQNEIQEVLRPHGLGALRLGQHQAYELSMKKQQDSQTIELNKNILISQIFFLFFCVLSLGFVSTKNFSTLHA